jgi:Transposase DDE domain group 1
VASEATAWRVLDGIDAPALARIRGARARAREVAWAQAAETGRLLSSTVGGFTIPGFVLDMDATIVVCHSEKESAAKTWKKTFGFHPLVCFVDATGEALAGILRPGNSGSNTAADHITVLDLALAQIPDEYRFGADILIRCDSAGASHAFLRHIRSLREHGVRAFFSVEEMRIWRQNLSSKPYVTVDRGLPGDAEVAHRHPGQDPRLRRRDRRRPLRVHRDRPAQPGRPCAARFLDYDEASPSELAAHVGTLPVPSDGARIHTGQPAPANRCVEALNRPLAKPPTGRFYPHERERVLVLPRIWVLVCGPDDAECEIDRHGRGCIPAGPSGQVTRRRTRRATPIRPPVVSPAVPLIVSTA